MLGKKRFDFSFELQPVHLQPGPPQVHRGLEDVDHEAQSNHRAEWMAEIVALEVQVLVSGADRCRYGGERNVVTTKSVQFRFRFRFRFDCIRLSVHFRFGFGFSWVCNAEEAIGPSREPVESIEMTGGGGVFWMILFKESTLRALLMSVHPSPALSSSFDWQD